MDFVSFNCRDGDHALCTGCSCPDGCHAALPPGDFREQFEAAREATRQRREAREGGEQ